MISMTEKKEWIHQMMVVTNRQIFIRKYGQKQEDWLPHFLDQIRYLAKHHPKLIVLREKDLPVEEYRLLAEQVQAICAKEQAAFAVHFFDEIAGELGAQYLHLPLWKLEEMRGRTKETRPLRTPEERIQKEQNQKEQNQKERNQEGLSAECRFGTSVHSVEDALLAERLGASWLFAGNVYETTCKEGLAGKGLEYLKAVSEAVRIPVYGIGGVSFERMEEILATGAAGGCMMSGFMTWKE